MANTFAALTELNHFAAPNAVFQARYETADQKTPVTITEVGASDPDARLNILAANGSRLLATTWGDTLSVLRCADGVVLASEPYDDDPAWEDVPDRHLVEVAGAEVTCTPLKGL